MDATPYITIINNRTDGSPSLSFSIRNADNNSISPVIAYATAKTFKIASSFLPTKHLQLFFTHNIFKKNRDIPLIDFSLFYIQFNIFIFIINLIGNEIQLSYISTFLWDFIIKAINFIFTAAKLRKTFR